MTSPMSDPTLELEKRAMAALRRRGADFIDPIDGDVIGIQARIKDLQISSGIDHKLKVVSDHYPVALLIQTSGGVLFFPAARDRALEILRREQVLDDLANV